jgi:hypothetical protein
MVPVGREPGHHSILHNDQKLLRSVRSLIRILRFLLGGPTGFLLRLDRLGHLLYLVSRSTLAVGIGLKVRVIAASFHLSKPGGLYGIAARQIVPNRTEMISSIPVDRVHRRDVGEAKFFTIAARASLIKYSIPFATHSASFMRSSDFRLHELICILSILLDHLLCLFRIRYVIATRVVRQAKATRPWPCRFRHLGYEQLPPET